MEVDAQFLGVPLKQDLRPYFRVLLRERECELQANTNASTYLGDHIGPKVVVWRADAKTMRDRFHNPQVAVKAESELTREILARYKSSTYHVQYALVTQPQPPLVQGA